MMDHQIEDAKFAMHILKKFKEPITRLANEGVRILARISEQQK